MEEIYPLEKFYIYFSPYTAHTVDFKGEIYPTLEHAYQCLKYSDQDIIKEIKNAKSPLVAWKISSKYKSSQKPEFKEKKLEVMKMLMELKVKQHKDVREALQDSGKLKIIKHIITYPSGDGFWDDGKDGKGLNHTGKLWMEIREELKDII